jgi:hypothetical protein
MKRLVKRALKAIYRRTEFLRRPIHAEFERSFKSCVSTSFDDVRVAMEDLVTEVYRLQAQVVELKDEVARLREGERTAA